MRYVPALLLSSIFLATAVQAAPVCWTPVPERSAITFSVDQAGAPLQGIFKAYTASLCFDGAGGSMRVDVDTASADTEEIGRAHV